MSKINDLAGEGFWYLATPYSKYPAGLEFACAHACNAAGQLLAAGVHVYSPIAHTHPIALHGGLDPFSHDMFLPLDEKIMQHARGALVVMMPGWKASKGVMWEIEYFAKAVKPVVYLEWPRIQIMKSITEQELAAILGVKHET